MACMDRREHLLFGSLQSFVLLIDFGIKFIQFRKSNGVSSLFVEKFTAVQNGIHDGVFESILA